MGLALAADSAARHVNSNTRSGAISTDCDIHSRPGTVLDNLQTGDASPGSTACVDVPSDTRRLPSRASDGHVSAGATAGVVNGSARYSLVSLRKLQIPSPPKVAIPSAGGAGGS
jgi:hypothetical protein